MCPGFLGGLFGRDRRPAAGTPSQQSATEAPAGPPGLVDAKEVSLRCAEAREEERRRVAVYLHDGPIQQLVNLVLRLDMVEKGLPPDANGFRKDLSDLRQFARDVLQDMRRFMFELRPASHDEFSLLPILRQYVQDFRTQYGIPVEIRLDDADWRLGRDVEINLFRVIQEALANVRKHARASRVDLSLNRRGSSVVVEVADDGTGFDVESAQARARSEKRLGLASMDDRTRALGGTLQIESSNRGTRVRATVTVPDPELTT